MPARKSSRASDGQLEIDFNAMSKNDEYNSNMEGPSALALKHEREISALTTGVTGIQDELGAHRSLFSKLERGMEEMAASLSTQIVKITDRITNKNPMVYIGLGSLFFGALTIASGLTLFAINAQIRPLTESVQNHEADMGAMQRQERDDFEKIIRMDERLKNVEERLRATMTSTLK